MEQDASPPQSRKASPASSLDGAKVARRLLFAAGATGATAWLATAPSVNSFELRLYRLFNRLPPHLEVPLAAVMQLGSLAAVPSSAAWALIAKRRALALDLALAGGTSWVSAKVAKRLVRRERPAALVAESLLRGRPQTGLGFPSGHSAIATALATVATPWLSAAARRGAWTSVAAVGIARMYVGAHLPVDVVGGVAMGSAIATGLQSWRSLVGHRGAGVRLGRDDGITGGPDREVGA
jgi:membrane-associated phospholipid phosphatase